MEDNLKHLKNIHEIEMEIMDLIHKICIDYDLKYSLAYGSLIGAVRHQGFIPWDDDIDIIMPRKDYEKFKEIWYTVDHKGFFLQDIDVEEEFTQNFMKIRKDNTLYLQHKEEKLNYHKGIFVDIFPLDKVSDNRVKRLYQYVFCAINLLLCRKFNSPTKNRLQLFVENAILGLPNFVKRKLRSYSFNVIKKYNSNKKLKYFGTSTIQELFNHFDNSIFDELEISIFENRQYYIIKKYDEVLSTTYGDYMQLPPEEDRTWKHPPIEIRY